ncbi:methionine--tRNA ligase [Actinoplanes sp. NPDC049548]|uniref:methionine--tRNA ligase n=1 Tax=Actinoplanes sp. NPDC049548 TaxID=3155152 RepID=UPI00341817D4
MTFYVTTAIPYVNAAPHLGHALELVQADVLARHRRARGADVRFLTGTDDNALKNVAAARKAGVPVQEFVRANGDRFAALREPLELSFDDFIRTSEARHRQGVEELWERSRGDFYRRRYTGLYCGGCEQFLDADSCPEHDTPPERVSEENWFFRLSRYEAEIRRILEDSVVRIEPAARRNEVLAFVRAGLRDISVSRSASRAGGWGIPVPGDPDQVVYVWWDALANYVTALDRDAYQRWWAGSGERVHVIGKGIVRFHAVYWLALLLSAGEPLPTRILVHDYLTVGGAKLSKSAGNAVDPVGLAGRYGTDALRWWLLRDVAPLGDTDFTVDRLVHRHDVDLANGVGNFLNRTLNLAYPDGIRPAPCPSDLPQRIDEALDGGDFRAATEAITDEVALGNRVVETERPWRLGGPRRADVVGELLGRCQVIATELEPFLPSAARRLRAELALAGPPRPAFARLGAAASVRPGR